VRKRENKASQRGKRKKAAKIRAGGHGILSWAKLLRCAMADYTPNADGRRLAAEHRKKLGGRKELGRGPGTS